MNIEQLNNQFGSADQINFIEGKGGFPLIEVRNDQAKALISTYAGQVLSYRPKGAAEDLLFLSERAFFQQGKAIKGGVPICWPWFGSDPEGLGRPAHGFVRNRPWSVLTVEADSRDQTRLVLGLEDGPETREIWPHAFELRLEISVGETLGLTLVTRNRGDQAFSITQALHTYFKVGDIDRVKVLGLEAKDYLDKVENGKRRTQEGAVIIDDEVDRIYLAVHEALVIDDPSLQRRIRIGSSGSETAVVWNPWSRLSAEMVDLEDDDYRHMLCVETANAAQEVVQLPPAGEYRLQAVYQIE
ncbi:MAG: D-hexose-6-phosphate mutarotase [Chromatiales bacterium]|jgi:glucose-6-phosphate 1-epimerase